MEPLKDLADRLRLVAARIDALSLVGIALAAAAAASYPLALQPVIADIELARMRAAEAERRLQLQPAMNQPRKLISESERLRAFYERFPSLAGVPALLANLDARARELGVAIESGDYALEEEKGTKLARYQLTLPVRGTYAQLRGFVHAALRVAPTASLDEVVLKRDNPERTAIDAKLRLTIYIGQTGRASP